ncbi:MAG: hypothetical protein NTV72_00240 [Candidatus Taylorbacteria bacterium]|nr:hypothetical protein [Candidatus Taylorbacteria bacterium]
MFNISKYLVKFSGIGDKERSIITLIKDVILKEIGINLVDKDIKLSQNTLTIRSSSPIKAMIFIKKQKILKEINEKIPNSIKDIR